MIFFTISLFATECPIWHMNAMHQSRKQYKSNEWRLRLRSLQQQQRQMDGIQKNKFIFRVWWVVVVRFVPAVGRHTRLNKFMLWINLHYYIFQCIISSRWHRLPAHIKHIWNEEHAHTQTHFTSKRQSSNNRYIAYCHHSLALSGFVSSRHAHIVGKNLTLEYHTLLIKQQQRQQQQKVTKCYLPQPTDPCNSNFHKCFILPKGAEY